MGLATYIFESFSEPLSLSGLAFLFVRSYDGNRGRAPLTPLGRSAAVQCLFTRSHPPKTRIFATTCSTPIPAVSLLQRHPSRAVLFSSPFHQWEMNAVVIDEGWAPDQQYRAVQARYGIFEKLTLKH